MTPRCATPPLALSLSSSPARSTARARRVTGGQGAGAVGGARRTGRELRAHPPEQPRRDGDPPPAVPPGRLGGLSWPFGRGGLFGERLGGCGRGPAAKAPPSEGGLAEGREGFRGPLAYRHSRRSRVLPPRRHPPLRAAPPPGQVALFLTLLQHHCCATVGDRRVSGSTVRRPSEGGAGLKPVRRRRPPAQR